MLTIEECEKKLKKHGENLSHEQIAKLRDWLYLLAEIELKQNEDEESDFNGESL